MEKWKRKKTELILDTKFFKVKKDAVELPTKEVRDWIYLDTNDSVMIIGMTKEKKLIMIRQYRYLVDNMVIEFPAGGLKDGENIEKGARREFQEESGFKCGSLVSLGSYYETYGQLRRRIHIFFSDEISRSVQDPDHGENEFEEIEVETVDFEKAIDLALENKIVAMGSSLAILMLKEKIARGEIII